MIKVKNLKKSFDNKPVLKGISCEFEKGKTSLIIGQTGSGKTVFLKCLLGLHKYDGGEVLFDKINLNSMTELEKMSLKSNKNNTPGIIIFYNGKAKCANTTISNDNYIYLYKY